MESNEVGKAFSVLGILQSLFPFVTKPFFSFLYKMTLEDFPGAFRVLTGSLYIFVLLLLIYTHFGMKKQERENKNEEQLGEEMVHLNNDKWGTVAMAIIGFQMNGAEYSVQNSATFPMLLLKSSKKVVFLSEISSK